MVRVLREMNRNALKELDKVAELYPDINTVKSELCLQVNFFLLFIDNFNISVLHKKKISNLKRVVHCRKHFCIILICLFCLLMFLGQAGLLLPPQRSSSAIICRSRSICSSRSTCSSRSSFRCKSNLSLGEKTTAEHTSPAVKKSQLHKGRLFSAK